MESAATTSTEVVVKVKVAGPRKAVSTVLCVPYTGSQGAGTYSHAEDLCSAGHPLSVLTVSITELTPIEVRRQGNCYKWTIWTKQA